jgi:hypothetical protein
VLVTGGGTGIGAIWALISDVTIASADELTITGSLTGLAGCTIQGDGGLLPRIVQPPYALEFVLNDVVPAA